MAAPQPEEFELAGELNEVLLSISRKTWEDDHQPLRSVHAKSHGILSAKLEVLPNLAPELAQGLFAVPATYEVVARLSTSPGDLLSDRVSTPRGMAIKVLDVPGERLEGSEDRSCQDFILVDGPQFHTPNARTFLRSLKLLASTTDRAPRTKQALSTVLRGAERAIEALDGESATIKSLGGHPATHILGETFFTQLPIRYGDYVAKLQLVPVNQPLSALKDEPIDLGNPDALREAVNRYFAQNTAIWELRVQLSTNLKDMPIEDASVPWDESQSPFRTVARLIAPRQVGWSAEKAKWVDDGMGFSPWQGIEEHRPLGDLMRLRKSAYAASQRFRSEKAGCPLHDRRLSEAGETQHLDDGL
ncbi:catalase family protein [Dyella jejuensis]|uniref:Catalase family protein n=2 Tax=Dyella jejuensis TaxID=1432009 RepID=A0ABW8JHR4_9GAMM